MKGDPCYADLDEFWVVGDLVAKAFMGWGGECHQCYIDGADPCEAERFSSYREARKYMKSDEDVAMWVKQHGGSRFAKPLRCRQSVVVYPPGKAAMIGQFVIVDTKCGKGCNLYQGETAYVPWIINAFTNDLQYAKRYESVEDARRDCDRFTKEKFDFDGNTPLKPGRLKVMEIALVPVEQGG